MTMTWRKHKFNGFKLAVGWQISYIVKNCVPYCNPDCNQVYEQRENISFSLLWPELAEAISVGCLILVSGGGTWMVTIVDKTFYWERDFRIQTVICNHHWGGFWERVEYKKTSGMKEKKFYFWPAQPKLQLKISWGWALPYSSFLQQPHPPMVVHFSSCS